MSPVRIYGDQGYSELKAPTQAVNTSLILPSGTGTSGQYLQTSGASGALSWATGLAQGSVITAGTAVASTSGTSIDFTGIPSWVKRVTVMFNGVSTNGTSYPLVRLGTSSGFISSGYVSTGITVSSSSSTAGTSDTTGLLLGSGSDNALISGHMIITTLGSNVWVSSNTCRQLTTNVIFGGGSVTLSGTLDRIRITTVNGTDAFDAGSINIMYEG